MGANPNQQEFSKRYLQTRFAQALRSASYARTLRLFLRCDKRVLRDELLTLQLATLYDHRALQETPPRSNQYRRSAICLCRRILRQSPQNPGASWGIARVLLQSRNRKALYWARRALRNAVRRDRILYVNNLALAQMKLGNVKRAHRLFLQASKMRSSKLRKTQVFVNWAILYDRRNFQMVGVSRDVILKARQLCRSLPLKESNSKTWKANEKFLEGIISLRPNSGAIPR